MNINPKDFDLNKFLLGNQLILETEQFKMFEKACYDLAIQKRILCLIAPGGTGLEGFLYRYKDKNQEEVYIVDCGGKELEGIFGDLMIELQFGHRLVNWYDTPIANILEALMYYLKETNNRTLLIFNNCDQLKIPVFSQLAYEIKRFRGNAGIICRITPSYGDKIVNSADPSLRVFLAANSRFVLDQPSEDDLFKACQENGIINELVARNLVKGVTDFDVVCGQVEQLYRDVRAHMENGTRRKK